MAIGSFDGEVVALLKATGLEPKRTSVPAPWQNGIAERWVGSGRREILDHVTSKNSICFSPCRLQMALAQPVAMLSQCRAPLSTRGLLLVSMAGWLGQQQRDAIDYLREENRVLREQLGNQHLRRKDEQSRRLAAKAKKLGRRILDEVARIGTPETLLA